MIKIRRPSNVPQAPSVPSEAREALEALRHSATFAKIRGQASQFRFPDKAKKAIIEWKHKNIEESETPPATPAVPEVIGVYGTTLMLGPQSSVTPTIRRSGWFRIVLQTSNHADTATGERSFGHI
jgi:hypothetical protein